MSEITQQQAERATGFEGRYIAEIDYKTAAHTSKASALTLNAIGHPHRCQLGRWGTENGFVEQRESDGSVHRHSFQGRIFTVSAWGPTWEIALARAKKRLGV